ncbi:ureidoglycolate lyase [Oricola cellulosilytica]|uniref:Ureidoglycolate lyase n=1 Tax=Oricola cellulosilytica TaxID=1429082 RepID=A0A4V2MNC6_9HYPH|nr:ureidoglycolate lyase [Oricola cellulosilytica]TCD12290.1 ureidoglycolate lyase [Oricola cellulosilytica]
MLNMKPEMLDADAFHPYGQVIDKEHARSFPINSGMCTRYHDLAEIDVTGPGARPIVSIVTGEPYELPARIPMVERHPFGSQAFIPLSSRPFLVVVCDDDDGTPANLKAFLTAPGQGVNFKRNVWHGILTPLEDTSDFVVVDWAGEGTNLEEHFFDQPYTVG